MTDCGCGKNSEIPEPTPECLAPGDSSKLEALLNERWSEFVEFTNELAKPEYWQRIGQTVYTKIRELFAEPKIPIILQKLNETLDEIKKEGIKLTLTELSKSKELYDASLAVQYKLITDTVDLVKQYLKKL